MSIRRQHAKTAASHTHHSKSDANPMQQPNLMCLGAKSARNWAKRQTMTALFTELHVSGKTQKFH
jgi:hypothetical protein